MQAARARKAVTSGGVRRQLRLLWLRDVPTRPVRIAIDAALAFQAADDTHGPSPVELAISHRANQIIFVKGLINLAVGLKKSLDNVDDALMGLLQMLLSGNSIRWGGSALLSGNPLRPIDSGHVTRRGRLSDI